jgi:hypothetical protein
MRILINCLYVILPLYMIFGYVFIFEQQHHTFWGTIIYYTPLVLEVIGIIILTWMVGRMYRAQKRAHDMHKKTE